MAAIDISKLSIEEKWELLDELWESIYESPEAAALAKPQREELDRRIEELDREIENGVYTARRSLSGGLEGNAETPNVNPIALGRAARL